MAEALKLAQQGMQQGDGGPFGAVIVRDGKIIGRGWNRVLATNDPTAHAEVMAIRDACARTGNYWLESCCIYVNCEPCPMCLAALYWARIETLVFGATRKDAAALGFADDQIYREINLPAAGRAITTSQCCRTEAMQIMQQWNDLESKQVY